MTCAPKVRPGGDRGATLIIFAGALALILTIVAMTIDLGQGRFAKRDGQSAADLAALSAGFYLAGNASPEDAVVSDPRGACGAAFRSARTNLKDFAPIDASIDAACAVYPADAGACGAQQFATLSDGPHTVRISYPVTAHDLKDDRFSNSGVGSEDGVKPCERMAVDVTTTRSTSFAQVVGWDEITTNSTSVVRGGIGGELENVAALLLLERVACGALQTSGGGSSGSGVVVRANGTVPGIIAADSAGRSPQCTGAGSNNFNGWVIYGTALPSNGGPSISVESAPGRAGTISTYADAVGGYGGAVAPTGISVASTPGTINSRAISDTKYNGVHAQIGTLHGQADTATSYTTDAAATAAGYNAVISTNAECGGNISPAKLNATKVYVRCTTFAPETNLFPNAELFATQGNIDIKNNKVLALPNVQRIFVRGCSTGSCSGPTGTTAISVSGTLLVNHGGGTDPALTGTTCDARSGPGYQFPNTLAYGTITNTTTMVTMSGSIAVPGYMRLCQTTLYIGENRTDYLKRTVPGTGSAYPENYPAIALCSPTKPCPMDGAAPLASLAISGNADWTAPNQLRLRPTSAQLASPLYQFEDLALWTESSTASTLKGQGANAIRGVFFLPNAALVFQGQATQDQPLNAQLLARTLNVSGQGSLFMRPNPADALDVVIPGVLALIR